MRTKKTIQTVYGFEELSDAAKDKAREWYRQASADDDFWYESVIEDAKTILDKFGFRNLDIYWSGFCCQGDGAYFTGTWHGSDCKPLDVTAYASQDEKLARIASEFSGVLVKGMVVGYEMPTATLSHRGSSSHEHSVRFEFDDDPGDDCDVITEASRALMRWIYSSLEAEYEYQGADEQVDDAICANGYDFTEEGERA